MKFIVDTSVWIGHLNRSNERLNELLLDRQALSHPSVLGELACGNLRDRDRVLGNLKLLPQANEVDVSEILDFIQAHRIYGKGLALVDIQLLASAILSDAGIFTQDRALKLAARSLHIDTLS